MFGRQVGDGDENTCHIAFLVLPSAKTEPIIKRSHTARKRRAIMFAKRFDRFDPAQSVKEMAMTLQSLDKTRGWISAPVDRREEGARSAPDRTMRWCSSRSRRAPS
jgi:hypothetical protein